MTTAIGPQNPITNLSQQARELAERIASQPVDALATRGSAEALAATLQQLRHLHLPSQFSAFVSTLPGRAIGAVREVTGPVLELGEDTAKAHRRLLERAYEVETSLASEVERRLQSFNQIMDALGEPERALLVKLAGSPTRAKAIEVRRAQLEREARPNQPKPALLDRVWSRLLGTKGETAAAPVDPSALASFEGSVDSLITKVRELNARIEKIGVTARIWVPFEGPSTSSPVPADRWEVGQHRPQVSALVIHSDSVLRSVNRDLTILRHSLREARGSSDRVSSERGRLLGLSPQALYAEAKQRIRDLESRAESMETKGTLEARGEVASTSTSLASKPTLGLGAHGELRPAERIIARSENESRAVIALKREYPLASGERLHFRISREPGHRTIFPGEDGHVFDRALALVRLHEALQAAHPESPEARELEGFMRDSSLVIHDRVPDPALTYLGGGTKPAAFIYPLADLRRAIIDQITRITPEAEYAAAIPVLEAELRAPLGVGTLTG